MSLCSTCLSVPILDILDIPSTRLAFIRTYVESEPGVITYGFEDENSNIKTIAHHNSLEELLASAVSCVMCDLIWRNARAVVHLLESEGKPRPQGSLWVCDRQDSQQGFSVLVPYNDLDFGTHFEQPQTFLLIAVVGFCVNEGTLGRCPQNSYLLLISHPRQSTCFKISWSASVQGSSGNIDNELSSLLDPSL